MTRNSDEKTLAFTAYGMVPAPKGSYRPVRVPTSAGPKTRLISMAKREKVWRQFVADEIRTTIPDVQIGKEYAVKVHATFYLPRPKRAPEYKRVRPINVPDLDKLCRALGDAMVDGGLLVDDSIIVEWHASKEYDDLHDVGCAVYIYYKPNVAPKPKRGQK